MTELTHPDARVLIVDDEGSIVRLLSRALEGAGYTSPVGFTDPIAALAFTQSNTPDLIVLDIDMPGMTGYDFLNDLSQYLNEDTFLPVLMVSGLPEAETRLHALQAGAINFLTKPIDLNVFIAHVHSLLETRYMSLRLQEVRGVLEAPLSSSRLTTRSSTAWAASPNTATTPQASTPTGWGRCAVSWRRSSACLKRR